MNALNLSDPNLLNTANNVAFSIQVALTPSTPQCSRSEANKFCENFRCQASPAELTSVGLILTCRHEVELVISGFQFLEHVVKYEWNRLQEREEVKERLIQLMQNGLPQFPGNCPSFLEEALARVIVEVVKREWPQLWPDLINRLCAMSDTSELPILVMRRMAEDIFSLQLVDCFERRKELSQGLNAVSKDIISVLFKHIVNSIQAYRNTSVMIHVKRGQLSLSCLLPYIECVTTSSFLEGKRIFILFSVLSEMNFKVLAADCLLQLLDRKPIRKEDRFEIPKMCLENECCRALVQAILDANSNEEAFLRKLGEILTSLAANSSKDKVNIQTLIKCIEVLASREEAVSVLGSAIALNQILKNIKKMDFGDGSLESPLAKSLINLLNLTCKKFVSAPPTPSEKEDMTRLKSEFCNMLRSIGLLIPKLYTVVNSWLHNSLSSPTAVQMFQWETLVLVMDAVASSVSHEDQEMVKIGLMDLEQCSAKFEAETSLELKSTILSSVSALFVFLSLAKQRAEFGESHQKLLLTIVESILKCFQYDESAKDIRRHAAALLIKLATKNSEVMALAFDYLHSSTSALAARLSPMEKYSLAEVMILTSNSWNDTSRQAAFIGTLFPQSDWEQISVMSNTVDNLVSMFQEHVFFENRGIFLTDLNILYSVLRRVKKPKCNPSNAVLNSSSSQNSVGVSMNQHSESSTDAETMTHPAYDHVCPLLPIIFKLVKSIHLLIDKPVFQYVFGITDQDKAHILGLHYNNMGMAEVSNALTSPQDGEKPFSEKIRLFVLTIQELCYNILGECAAVLAPKFYYIPQLSDAYLNFVGCNTQHLSDFRLRGILRSVFKPYLISCPIAQFPTVVIPFAQNYFPFMLTRLVNRWNLIENTKTTDADGEEEKEVLENSSLRLLTKEYSELVFRLLDTSVGSNSSQKSANNEEQMDMDNEMDGKGNGVSKSNGSNQSSGNSGELSGAGSLLLADTICYRSILQFCVSALCWDDSLVVLKTARCLLMAWNAISREVEIVRWVYATALRAVCLWVDNEANVDGLLRLIEHIFKNVQDKDPSFSQVLLEWGATQEDIKKLTDLCKGAKNEKKRKELFRKMVLNNSSVEKNKSPKAQWLTGLPNLIVQNQDKISKQNRPEVDLTECFSMIHK